MRVISLNRLTVCTLAVLALAISADAVAQQRDLLAPAYPGSLPVASLPKTEFPEGVQAFLSKDPLATVRAYYDREVGKMENATLSDLNVPEGMRSEQSKDNPYVFALGLQRDEYLGVLGVQVTVQEPREKRAPTTYDAVGPIFEKLMMGKVNGEGTQAQLDALVEEYKHASWMFYPLTAEQDDRGRPLTEDEVVLRSCEKKASGGMNREELQAKMEQLMKEGKLQEMQQLAQSSQAASGVDTWDVWVDCLKKMESAGYRTLIVIHERSAVER